MALHDAEINKRGHRQEGGEQCEVHYPNLRFLPSQPYEYLLFPFLMMMFQPVCVSRKKGSEMRLLYIRSQNVLILIA